MGNPVVLTKGSSENFKITSPMDIKFAAMYINGCSEPVFRIGHGYDVHKLADNRKLVLGGVEIMHAKGLLGHSDADVLLHAIMDALLGAAGLGDIGRHFPDHDNAFKDVSSRKLLQMVVGLLRIENHNISNIDATIVAQNPKVSGYIDQIKNNIAEDCGIDSSLISIKATTEEGLGFTGNEQGIAAHAVCLIFHKKPANGFN
jgi:2-C-methyl-D-erythritol 2,4-cyclodiphosphate synthase